MARQIKDRKKKLPKREKPKKSQSKPKTKLQPVPKEEVTSKTLDEIREERIQKAEDEGRILKACPRKDRKRIRLQFKDGEFTRVTKL